MLIIIKTNNIPTLRLLIKNKDAFVRNLTAQRYLNCPNKLKNIAEIPKLVALIN